jgi:hypothetical protein
VRIVWAIPCKWVRPANTPGRVDIYDGQIDTMTVGAGDEVDVAIRVSGPQEDFAMDHSLQITLRDSEVVEIKKLELPIYSIVRIPPVARLRAELAHWCASRLSPSRRGRLRSFVRA